jgi:glutamyl-tRNA synthetase
MTVRTRIAPSPTGDPHVGTAYVALFNEVFARSQGGEFIVRIEDTDRQRSTLDSEAMILDALAWLGIEWTEGPDRSGPHGAYRQSERREIYTEHAQQLLDAGHAFHCFCTPERLDEVRAAQQKARETTRYDGLCLGLEKTEAEARIAAGEAHVVRMKVPTEGSCTFEDRFRGEIEIPWTQIDMQVLMKADGYPTYHLAVVVDDHLMEISHVLRGEEWIPSTPKHLMLYQYFGWQPPEFGHLPLLRNPDKSKLSKRKNPTSVNYYRASGYLPEALLNYLGRMGWSMPDEREIFSHQELIDAFDLDRISLGAPVFDIEKLNWLNGQYVRALDPDEFMDRIAEWAINRDHLKQFVPLIQERTERFIDLVPQLDYLLGDRRELSAEDFELKGLDEEGVKRVLQFTLWSMDQLPNWERDRLFELCNALAEALGLKIRDFLSPLFIAISGRRVALPLFDSMALLGSDLTRMRVRSALDALGGVSKKKAKVLEREYRGLVDSTGGDA